MIKAFWQLGQSLNNSGFLIILFAWMAERLRDRLQPDSSRFDSGSKLVLRIFKYPDCLLIFRHYSGHSPLKKKLEVNLIMALKKIIAKKPAAKKAVKPKAKAPVAKKASKAAPIKKTAKAKRAADAGQRMKSNKSKASKVSKLKKLAKKK